MKGPAWRRCRVITGLHALPRAALHEYDRMTRDQRRALRRLSNVPRGIAETLMLANGFKGESIDGLVLAGLATVVTDTARIGGETIKVDLVMITDAGRKAIEG